MTRSILIVLSIALIAFIAIVMARGRISDRPEPVAENGSQSSNSGQGVRPQAIDVIATGRRPLPPANAPLVTIVDDLSSRSKAGDAEAAMRLFKDLSRCSARQAQLQQINRLSFPSNQGDAGESVVRPDIVNKNLEQLDATDDLCKGINQALIDSRGEQLRQAALDGDAEAMVCYSMSTTDRSPPYLSNAWFDYVDRWSREAPLFAQKAFNLGKGDVIPLLMDAYTPADSSTTKNFEFSQLIAPDARLAYGLAILWQRLVPPSEAAASQNIAMDLGKNLSDEQKQWANDFASANFSRFASSAGDTSNLAPCFGVL